MLVEGVGVGVKLVRTTWTGRGEEETECGRDLTGAPELVPQPSRGERRGTGRGEELSDTTTQDWLDWWCWDAGQNNAGRDAQTAE